MRTTRHSWSSSFWLLASYLIQCPTRSSSRHAAEEPKSSVPRSKVVDASPSASAAAAAIVAAPELRCNYEEGEGEESEQYTIVN